MESTPEIVVIYDSTCRFCTASLVRLSRLVCRPFEAVPSGSERALAYVPAGQAALDRQIHTVVNGRLYGGAEAIARLLMANPWWGPVAWLYYLPGVRRIADSLYRQVAARRHGLGDACVWDER